MYKIKKNYTCACNELVPITEPILSELVVARWNYLEIQQNKLHLNRLMTVEDMDIIYLHK
jgi:hypothetical protein